MNCPKCNSDKVNVQMVQEEKKKSTFEKVATIIVYPFLFLFSLCTFFILKPHKLLKSKQKFVNEKRAVCQSCGDSWKV